MDASTLVSGNTDVKLPVVQQTTEGQVTDAPVAKLLNPNELCCRCMQFKSVIDRMFEGKIYSFCDCCKNQNSVRLFYAYEDCKTEMTKEWLKDQLMFYISDWDRIIEKRSKPHYVERNDRYIGGYLCPVCFENGTHQLATKVVDRNIPLCGGHWDDFDTNYRYCGEWDPARITVRNDIAQYRAIIDKYSDNGG